MPADANNDLHTKQTVLIQLLVDAEPGTSLACAVASAGYCSCLFCRAAIRDKLRLEVCNRLCPWWERMKHDHMFLMERSTKSTIPRNSIFVHPACVAKWTVEFGNDNNENGVSFHGKAE